MSASENDSHDDGATRGDRMIERTAAATRAVIVVPVLSRMPRGSEDERGGATPNPRSPDARLEEAVGLALAIDLDIVANEIVTVTEPRPATLLGSGKVEEIGAIVSSGEAGLVVVDHPLSPVQQRNLEKAWNAKVLDRTGIILEIFGRRARTREGVLQVELAHLNYQRGRLVRSWTHLERQRGGAGFLGGPGETQIEADRRMLQEKIVRLKRELETVRRTRDLHRSKRRKVPYPVVAIVGYTNAGKSTLFNRLTGAEVLAQDMLFATLDPTLRRLRLPHGTMAILSDTVGFISDLPTHLVAAFRATLEEVIEADLVLHVRDASDPDMAAQGEDVERILSELGVETGNGGPVVEVLNKIDLLDDVARATLLRPDGERERPAISAVTGEGIDALMVLIEARISGVLEEASMEFTPADGALIDWVYRNASVQGRTDLEDGSVRLDIRAPRLVIAELAARRSGREG